MSVRLRYHDCNRAEKRGTPPGKIFGPAAIHHNASMVCTILKVYKLCPLFRVEFTPEEQEIRQVSEQKGSLSTGSLSGRDPFKKYPGVALPEK